MLVYDSYAPKAGTIASMKSNIHFQVALITHWKCFPAN